MVKFTDNLKIVVFKSNYDNSPRELLLSIPLDFDLKKTYPLIISPHPFGFSNLENYSYGTPDLLEPFKGWKGIPEKYKILLAIPYGHGKVFDSISLSWEGQMADIRDMPTFLKNDGFKLSSIYIGGLSMGGMESLTALGMFPELFSAGFSFNGIADLKAWYLDIINNETDKKMLEMEVPSVIEQELGGTPKECANEYLKRSAINYIKNLAKVPIKIYWSSKESIVVNQEIRQTRKLFDSVKELNPDAEIYEHDHSFEHGFKDFDETQRIRCHEFCDFDLATKWLLNYK